MKPKIVDLGEHGWAFHCPGCMEGHSFKKDGRWKFNGDLERPSFSPSLVSQNADGSTKCHLFLTSGKLIFLDNCQHELAGQEVPFEEFGGDVESRDGIGLDIETMVDHLAAKHGLSRDEVLRRALSLKDRIEMLCDHDSVTTYAGVQKCCKCGEILNGR